MKFRHSFIIILLALINVLFSQLVRAQSQKTQTQKNSAFWVDSVFNSLTADERIAQLIMIRAYSNKDEKYNQELIKLISDLNIGGVCFFQGGPVRQANLTNRIQQNVETPVFVSIDAEWGPGMRLDSVLNFPKQMTLGAISDNSLIYDMGKEVARQLKRFGVHMNFAPVADINNNPANPVINARSFGENRQNVAEKSYWYMKGMQDEGIIAVAKHFPGHGDTGTDSHYTLPVVDKLKSTLDSLEIFPFNYLINRGLKGMMIAHLKVPALDDSPSSISSLSKPVITGILRNQLGFDGMVITDGMDMKGLTDFADPLMAEVLALDAGNDILLLPSNAKSAIINIRKAIEKKLITQELIDSKCRRVLQWKFKSGLAAFNMIQTINLTEDLNSDKTEQIIHNANACAITLLSDRFNTIPLKSLDTLRIATLAIGDTVLTPFQQRLNNYSPVTHFNLGKEPTKADCDLVIRRLQNYDLVITGFVQTSDLPKRNFGISRQAAALVDSLAVKQKVILTLFTSPYSVGMFKRLNEMAAVIVSYQDNGSMQDLTAQAIFGGSPITGRLPVSANREWTEGHGISRNEVIRVSFAKPNLAGFSSEKLKEVDEIVLEGLNEKAYPGAQIVVIKDGTVVLNKAYGSITYESVDPLKTDDIFDLASLTKILATTLATMKLTEEGLIEPDRRLSYYYKPLHYTNKNELIIRDILAHQAKLIPYIPFWKKAMDGDILKSDLFGAHFSINFTHRVADGIYLKDEYPDAIIDSIINTPLLTKTDYKYSDLGFILLSRAIEDITNQPINSYLHRNFYDKLGLSTMGYHPRDRFSLSRIAPTENDTIFRKQLVHGDVHDQTAALMGGVAGHAGLFSHALDVAVLMQMLLNGGVYGGDTLLDAKVISDFTGVQYILEKNRRGAGFDKPALLPKQPSPACASASPRSFGHSGFTGTYTWADPENNLVYVFLSNRVYPNAENTTITSLSIRTRIHQAIYDAIIKTK
ncbi:MAG: serine hydrolase [Lentimicrobium sp.]|nr:serine hydrolase [Lentimicrobium sp.]